MGSDSEEDATAQARVRLQVHSSALVLDLAYAQYPLQWQRIGTMQQSAGSLMTLISIVAALIVGILTQIDDADRLLVALGNYRYSFYLTLVFSFIYLIIALGMIFRLLRPKEIDNLRSAVDLLEPTQRAAEAELQRSGDYESALACANIVLTDTISMNIREVDNVLKNNHRSYWKCLISAFFSLGCSFAVLGHLVIGVISTPDMVKVLIGIVGYALCLGVVLVILYPRRSGGNESHEPNRDQPDK